MSRLAFMVMDLDGLDLPFEQFSEAISIDPLHFAADLK